MPTITTWCPTCGEVTLPPGGFELRLAPVGRAGSHYAFTCPACGAEIRKPADEHVVRLLQVGGVPVRHLLASSGRRGGPRLTHDDLLDFHTLLARDDWFDDLVALVRGERIA